MCICMYHMRRCRCHCPCLLQIDDVNDDDIIYAECIMAPSERSNRHNKNSAHDKYSVHYVASAPCMNRRRRRHLVGLQTRSSLLLGQLNNSVQSRCVTYAARVSAQGDCISADGVQRCDSKTEQQQVMTYLYCANLVDHLALKLSQLQLQVGPQNVSCCTELSLNRINSTPMYTKLDYSSNLPVQQAALMI